MGVTHASDKSRILAVSQILPTNLRPESGVFVLNFLMGLVAHGVDVEAVAPIPAGRWVMGERGLDVVVGAKPLRVSRPLCLSIPSRIMSNKATRYLNRSSESRALFRAGRRACRPDVIYAHFAGAALGALRLGAFFRCPVIVGIGESSLPAAELALRPVPLGHILSSCARVLALSPELQRQCIERTPGHVHDRIVVLGNGVDTDRFRPMQRAQARGLLGIESTRPVVAFCGHLRERKGPLRVLAAAAQVGAACIFLGQGPQRPSGEHVIHVGAVPNKELPLWYSACDVFVLPSLAEGMNNATLEALACGLPVVVSDRGFNRWYLDEGAAVFVDPLDPCSIAQGIRLVLSNRDRFDSMKHQARETALRHSLSLRVARFVEIARGAIQEHRSRDLTNVNILRQRDVASGLEKSHGDGG